MATLALPSARVPNSGSMNFTTSVDDFMDIRMVYLNFSQLCVEVMKNIFQD